MFAAKGVSQSFGPVQALKDGSISNGRDVLALESSLKFMVTGGVLLIAVIVDAIARGQRRAAGRI